MRKEAEIKRELEECQPKGPWLVLRRQCDDNTDLLVCIDVPFMRLYTEFFWCQWIRRRKQIQWDSSCHRQDGIKFGYLDHEKIFPQDGMLHDSCPKIDFPASNISNITLGNSYGDWTLVRLSFECGILEYDARRSILNGIDLFDILDACQEGEPQRPFDAHAGEKFLLDFCQKHFNPESRFPYSFASRHKGCCLKYVLQSPVGFDWDSWTEMAGFPNNEYTLGGGNRSSYLPRYQYAEALLWAFNNGLCLKYPGLAPAVQNLQEMLDDKKININVKPVEALKIIRKLSEEDQELVWHNVSQMLLGSEDANLNVILTLCPTINGEMAANLDVAFNSSGGGRPENVTSIADLASMLKKAMRKVFPDNPGFVNK